MIAEREGMIGARKVAYGRIASDGGKVLEWSGAVRHERLSMAVKMRGGCVVEAAVKNSR